MTVPEGRLDRPEGRDGQLVRSLDSSEHYYERWRLAVASPTDMQIDLASTRFDPIAIVVRQPGDDLIAANDDHEGPDSRIVWTSCSQAAATSSKVACSARSVME
jgi:hypothetical protein